jgi:putative ABC transport system permease protein
MFSKLAFKNVTRSLKDYSVYFITLAFGVCLFYTFNSLEHQPVMVFLGENRHYMVESILTLVNVVSGFVSVILALLILYANSFMIRRRKRELGTYFLLGLPQGRVAGLFFTETLIIGLGALAVGLVLGVFFSQALSLFTLGMFQVSAEFLRFTVSPGAIGKTALYFGVIFLLVMVLSGISISRCKLIDLIQADRKHEDMRDRPLLESVVLFLVGVVLLIVAYAMLLIRGMLYIDALFFVMLGLGTLGTLLFFRSLSGFLLRICKRRESLYYKGLNMFILRQFNSKIHTTYLSMTAICLMLLLAIGITACSVGLNDTITALTDGQAPYDFSIQNYNGDTEQVDLEALLEEQGFDAETLLSKSLSYLLYYNDPAVTGVETANGAVTYSDYNALMEMQGRPALEGGQVQLREEPLLVGNFGMDYVVVPDEMAGKLPIRRQILVGDYAGDREAAEALLLQTLDRPGFYEQGSFQSQTRLGIYMDQMGSKVLVLYLGLYLGVVFLVVSAAVLALQQLSQASDNAARYQILARLGVEEHMRDRSIFVQVFLSFFLPLALAVVHSVVGMTAANAVISEVGRVDSVRSSVVTALFLLAVYGAYFLATYLGSRRIVRGR